MFKNGMRPVHPGELLREDFLIPLKMSANALAAALKVPAPRINDIVRERRGVSADTALRLARYFGGRNGVLFHPMRAAPPHAPSRLQTSGNSLRRGSTFAINSKSRSSCRSGVLCSSATRATRQSCGLRGV